MNAERRKLIATAHAKFNTIQESLVAIRAEVEEVKGMIEDARDEEQEYYDNMPEALQGGEKGSTAEQNVNGLDDIITALEEFSEGLEPDIDFDSYEA